MKSMNTIDYNYIYSAILSGWNKCCQVLESVRSEEHMDGTVNLVNNFNSMIYSWIVAPRSKDMRLNNRERRSLYEVYKEVAEGLNMRLCELDNIFGMVQQACAEEEDIKSHRKPIPHIPITGYTNNHSNEHEQ